MCLTEINGLSASNPRMAQSTVAPPRDPSASAGQDAQSTTQSDFDVRSEQLAHTKRILDLQIEGSRAIYRDALGIFLLNVIALLGLFASSLVVTALGGLTVASSAQVSVVLLGFGTLALFVSMAFATKAYLGDIADYAKPVTNAEGESYAEKSISRNVSIIKRNARIMETKVEGIRTAMLSMVGGLGGLFLALGFQFVALDSWAQVLVSLNALVVIGYLLVKVMGIDYFESQKDRLLR